jgi:transposase
MFIRKTKKTEASTKKNYFVYQLVESVRTERGPRQRILLSLGSKLDLPEAQHKALADRIEEIFTGAPTLFPCSEEIEGLAQQYASQLVNHYSKRETLPAQEADYQTIDLNTIEQQEPRTVGSEHLLLQMAEQLKFPQKLKELGLSERDVVLSLATIFGRAIFPASERATHFWLTKKSGLGELIDFDFQTTSLDQLYRISDTLLTHKEALENHLSETQASLHGYQSTMVLYDLTNTYMEGQAKSNPKAARGFSKEKRTDCPLITLGLVINEHGFTARSSILPGNVSEPSTLEKMIESLHSADDLFKPIIVLDAGIATEDNLKWLRTHHYKYVVSARQQAPSMELQGEPVSVDDSGDEQIKVALIKGEGEEEKWLYCESKAKEAVASKMKIFFKLRFEADLKKIAEGLCKPRGRKKYGKILERIGRLKEKHSRISGCYQITVHPSVNGEEASHIHWEELPEKMEAKLPGHYFLRTNLTDIEAVPLWNLYNTIRTVEDAFRFMKSDLGMRPVRHRKECRVDGHLWITLLAYHLIKSCLYQLKKAGLSCHWETVRTLMNNRVRVTMRAKTEKGEVVYHRSTTKAEEHQQKIYQALGLKTQVLKSKKFIG